jgi:hypothetical protein
MAFGRGGREGSCCGGAAGVGEGVKKEGIVGDATVRKWKGGQLEHVEEK